MFKNLLKSILPVMLLKFINNILGRSIKIVGEYSSWKQALNYSTGYNDNIIFSNSKKSFLKVLNNKAEYERDSVLFYKENINYSLIKILDEISFRLKITVNILDFGGSFASTYLQNKKFLNSQKKFIWSVVEQKEIVNYANSLKIKKKIKNFYSNLNFYLTVKNYLKYHSPDLVLFSGVLQYLSKPFDILNFLTSQKIKYFLILRTPFHKLTEQIKIQIVPKYIYKSSYPIRIFNEISFLNDNIKKRYFNKIYNQILLNKIDSWAFLWLLLGVAKNSKFILPKCNLVKNTGTQIHGANSTPSRLDHSNSEIFKLTIKYHPKKNSYHHELDSLLFNSVFRPKNALYPWRIIFLLRSLFLDPFFFYKSDNLY